MPDEPKAFSDFTYTVAATNTSTASAITFDDIAKMVDELDRLKPPPPNPKECANCKEPMEHDGQPIYSGTFPFFGTPACYVCGRCYYLLREVARRG